jgi:hypothetical protein
MRFGQIDSSISAYGGYAFHEASRGSLNSIVIFGAGRAFEQIFTNRFYDTVDGLLSSTKSLHGYN